MGTEEREKGYGAGARWIAPLCALLVVLAVSAFELALADRKYGLFTGGFGMSRAIDTGAELAQFAGGYALVQALAALAGWWVATRLARGGAWWQACFIFALLNGLLFLGIIAARYQLHSYFSDTVGFALLKQLGGGSLLDALLYGSSEIGMALLALVGAGLAAWLAWRLAGRFLPAGSPPAASPRPRWFALALLASLATSFAVNRTGSDAAYGLNRMLAWSALGGAFDTLSDVDLDGYGVFAAQYDTAPFDAARHPLALDIPGNGVDEDGYGGDLSLVALPPPLPAQRLTGKRPHLVLVVMESTRADVLGKRIGGRSVAPHLEALAAAGDRVVPAYSHVGFTTESMKSIFTGQLAPLPGDPSLFTDLAQSGYRIGVFSGQAEDFGGISETVGMRRSADVFVDAESLRDKRAFDFAAQASLLVDEMHLLAAFDESFAKRAWREPHFAYFNFQSAHFPYDHSGVARRLTDAPLARGELTAARKDQVAATYWNAVAHADAALGALVARLRARGVWDDTLLLVTGDHGEDLFEQGFLGHGHLINARQSATFLVASRPDVLPKGPVALADYRAIALRALTGRPPAEPAAPPFLHIGPLDTPTAIGLAGPGGRLTGLRLDTDLACFVEQDRCAPYTRLTGPDRARADAAIARWGSERWRARNRQSRRTE